MLYYATDDGAANHHNAYMLSAVQAASLCLCFPQKLCALAAFRCCGFATGANVPLKWLLGTGTPVVAAALWSIFAAPKANIQPTTGAPGLRRRPLRPDHRRARRHWTPARPSGEQMVSR